MSTHAFAPTFPLAFAPASSIEVPEPVSSENSFAMVQSGPPVPSDEVESHLDAVEVVVRWGSQVLAVKHLAAGGELAIGEGTDLALPDDVLGSRRTPIVVAPTRRGIAGAAVVIPAGARGSVTMSGAEPETLSSLLARGALAGSASLAGAHELSLLAGMKVVMELGGVRADGTVGEPITIEIDTVRAGKVAPTSFLSSLAGGALGFVGLSFLGHAAIVASMAMFMPSMTDDSEAIDREQILLMQKLLSASAERAVEEVQQDGPSEDSAGGGSDGAAHKGEEGASGTPTSSAKSGRMAFKGNDDDRRLSHREELAAAREFGLISLLGTQAVNSADPFSSKWSDDTYKGKDGVTAHGQMFGETIGDVAGTGLGLWGTGEGGGGTANVIGVGNVHTVGGGGGGPGEFGIGRGDKDGIGNGHGPTGGGHKPKALKMRPSTIETNGRLPAEVIQRIVRQNFGRFRMCYEAGLRGNPSLSGRVTTRFVIGRDGAVNQAVDAGSDLPDQQVVACMVRSFHSLSFPSPEGGIATVTYPISLSPGE